MQVDRMNSVPSPPPLGGGSAPVRPLERVLCFGDHRTGPGNPESVACLSQWYPAPFQEGSLRFPTAEHYMMHAKALLFGDRFVARLVLLTDNPAEALALGRMARGFDGAAWASQREAIVFRGNMLKFGQHTGLRAHLRASAPRLLVDANPADMIWGAGLAAADPRIEDPASWPGKNRLGEVLMRVRSTLLPGSTTRGLSRSFV